MFFSLLAMFIATRDASGSTPVALWSFTTGGAVDSSPVLSNDGSTLYVQSNEDGQRQLYAIYALNGSKMWSSPTGDAAKYSGGKQGYNPVLNSAVNIVYVKNDEYLYALDAVSGATNYIIDVGAGSSVRGHSYYIYFFKTRERTDTDNFAAPQLNVPPSPPPHPSANVYMYVCMHTYIYVLKANSTPSVRLQSTHSLI